MKTQNPENPTEEEKMIQTKESSIPERELEALRQALAKALIENTLNQTQTKPTVKTSGLSEEGKSLVILEGKLTQAISQNDKKTRGRIYNGLVDLPRQQFFEFLRLINKKVMSEDGLLAKTIMQSFVDHGKTKNLFELLQDGIFNEAKDRNEGDRILITTLHWLGSHPQFSSSVIKTAMKDLEMENQIKFMIFYCLKHGLKFRTTQPDGFYFPWLKDLAKKEIERCFAWPLIPVHREWVEKILPPVYQQWEKEEAHFNQVWENIPDWEALDCLWSKIETERIYGLHLDGDMIQFKVPELALYRITGVTLKKSAPFPCAEVIIHCDTFGVKQEIYGRLVNGRLDFAEFYWCAYAQWLVTLAVMIGYHQIVTGQEPEDDPWYTKCGQKKTNEPIERRPAKPHFYTLRSGHKASDEARANCLYYFGRELAPGKTFRVGKKMVVYTKKKISTVVTQETILRHTANV